MEDEPQKQLEQEGMFWAEGTARVKVLRRRLGRFREQQQASEAAVGLWSVVRLKSQESDQTGPHWLR